MSLFDLDLPAEFAWIRVGDAYEVTKKPRGLDISSVEAVPFATMEAMPQGGAYTPDYDFRPPQAIRTGTYFERGDVLVAKITPSFENGKQALVTELPAPFGFATTEVIPLRPRHNGQDRRFLFFYLLHPDVRHHVAERMEGSTGRQRVPTEVLLDLPYPSLPPEQQVIVAESLESLLRLKSVEEQSIATAQALKRAAMHTLFTRGLRGEAQKETEIGPIPESWELKLLSDHFAVISGGTPSRRVQEFWLGGTIPWVKTTEVDYCVIRKTEEYITRAGLEQSAAKVLPPGTLLLAMYGQGVTRGKVAILGIEATCNQACAAISPNDGAVDSKYLYHFLLFRYESIRQMAHGGQQQNLNLEIVRNLPLPIPPTRDEQHEIVVILDAIDRKIDLHRKKRAVLEELFKALLHKLMTGEIRVGELEAVQVSTAERDTL